MNKLKDYLGYYANLAAAPLYFVMLVAIGMIEVVKDSWHEVGDAIRTTRRMYKR
jgi:hypothetical protein